MNILETLFDVKYSEKELQDRCGIERELVENHYEQKILRLKEAHAKELKQAKESRL